VIDNPTAVPTSWNMARFDTLVQSDPRFLVIGPVLDDGDSWIYLSAIGAGGKCYMCRVSRSEITKGRVTTPQWWRATSQWAYDKPELVGNLYGRAKRQGGGLLEPEPAPDDLEAGQRLPGGLPSRATP
jgi:hypothetical protein